MNNDSLPARKHQAHESVAPLCRASDRLTEAIDAAAAPERRAADGRAVRSDGWTPERIRTFLETLADSGVVSRAARAAGMSVRAAYGFRERRAGAAFRIAWEAALELGYHRLEDEIMQRALYGSVEIIIRDGQVWGERHRHHQRTDQAMLARLDQRYQKPGARSAAAHLVIGDFDRFVDIVCDGGEAAGDFLVERAREEAIWGPEQDEALAQNVELIFANWKASEQADETPAGGSQDA